MSTQEILSIIALSLLGLCFLCGLAKMAMKKDSDKKNCDKACSMAIFAAVALVGVSQLLTEEKYEDGDTAKCQCWDSTAQPFDPPLSCKYKGGKNQCSPAAPNSGYCRDLHVFDTTCGPSSA